MDQVFVNIANENEWIRNEFNHDYISVDDLLNKIQELIDERESLKEQINDFDNNYITI